MLIADPNDARAMELVELNPVTPPAFALSSKKKALLAEYNSRLADGRIIRISQKEIKFCRVLLAQATITGTPVRISQAIARVLQRHYREIYDTYGALGEIVRGDQYNLLVEDLSAVLPRLLELYFQWIVPEIRADIAAGNA